jgi:putative CocE/NonD family hydrolase
MILSQPEYDIAVFRNVMVAMRDGVRLATDVYRPARDGALVEGRFPTILCRTAYYKAAQRYIDIADYFTPRGYAVVLQDVRGRHHSEGMGQYFHSANPNEGIDGYDTVEWVAAQDWSNGRVGTVGSSFPGLTQVRMALHRPPHLTTIWPDVTPINMYDHQSRRGGAMQLQMFGALYVHALDAQEIRDDPAAKEVIVSAMEGLRELVYATPFKAGQTPLAVVPNLEKTLMDYYTRGDYDEYWAAEYNDFQRYFERHADIPITLTGGWYDLFANATPDYFNAMRAQNTAPVRLIMGPWNHTAMRGGQSFGGDVDFGPASVWGNDRYFREQLRWFERWLKDQSTGVEDDPPVTIFVMGGGDGQRTREGRLNHGGAWRAEREWPLARTQWTKFYLGSGGRLTAEAPEGPNPQTPPSPRMRGEPEGGWGGAGGEVLSATFPFDPAHPVPTIGASSSGLMELAPLGDGLDPFWSRSINPWSRLRSIVMEGAAHQKEEPGMVGARSPYLPLAMRSDVLVFQTEPLAEDVEVTGPIEVYLWISSSAVDTDFTAKLIDVYPPNANYPGGYHLNLTDSILRVRYREGFDQPTLMTPGEIYHIRISLAPTSNLFQAGHRIRLDISSSNFPRFDINPNTGEPMGRHTHTVVARNTVYFSKDYPSHVVLPVIPGTQGNRYTGEQGDRDT